MALKTFSTVIGTKIQKNVTKIQFMSQTFEIGDQHRSLAFDGVGDGFGCHQDLGNCHQHPKIVTNIMSPISTCHEHACSEVNY